MGQQNTEHTRMKRVSVLEQDSQAKRTAAAVIAKVVQDPSSFAADPHNRAIRDQREVKSTQHRLRS
jgi:hypothetical protein